MCFFKRRFYLFFSGFFEIGIFLIFWAAFFVRFFANVFCFSDSEFCYYTVFANFVFLENMGLFLLDGEVNKK